MSEINWPPTGAEFRILLCHWNLSPVLCGKTEQLKIMLDEILDEGHKVIIFSQFTSLLKLVRENLGYGEKNSVYLDGSPTSRIPLIKMFSLSASRQVIQV
jgi:SNF2 family DNA or RNA helicase